MILQISMKLPGSRKAFLACHPFEFEPAPRDLRGFLTTLVKRQVALYNSKEPGEALKFFAREEELRDTASLTGKVGFGARYGEQRADEAESIENAILAFEDGLFRVFAGEEELTELDAPREFREQETFTLIRLVMLAGRMY